MGSTEEEKNVKTEERYMEKRGIPNENELRKRREKEIRKESAREQIETPVEWSDIFQSETSFMDLPDEILSNIFTFLDLPSRLKLRLNKRLDRVHFSVKTTIEEITFEIRRQDSQLSMDYHAPVNSSDCLEWEEALLRFAQNTFVNSVTINLFTVPNEQQCRIIDTLFHFNANVLEVIDSSGMAIVLSQFTLSSLRTLAQNVRNVNIGLICPSLSPKHLCIIRKTMREGSFMKSFGIKIGNGMDRSFMKECFGVIIEDVSEPVPGQIFRSQEDSLEMYHFTCTSFLEHFESDLRTYFNCYFGFLEFKKLLVVKKPHDNYKIKLNHVYWNS